MPTRSRSFAPQVSVFLSVCLSIYTYIYRKLTYFHPPPGGASPCTHTHTHTHIHTTHNIYTRHTREGLEEDGSDSIVWDESFQFLLRRDCTTKTQAITFIKSFCFCAAEDATAIASSSSNALCGAPYLNPKPQTPNPSSSNALCGALPPTKSRGKSPASSSVCLYIYSECASATYELVREKPGIFLGISVCVCMFT